MSSNHLVIMAGGVGSRFWPMSTEDSPKQFMDVLGCGRTLLQLTMDRFAGICPVENVWVLTSEKYALCGKYRSYTRVKVAEVAVYNPELFDSLVHVKASDAEKIIGRRALYLEARDILGSSDIQKYEVMNSTELSKVVPAHVFERLTEKEERLMDYVIEEVSSPSEDV